MKHTRYLDGKVKYFEINLKSPANYNGVPRNTSGNDCNIKLKSYNCTSKQGIFNRRQHGGAVIYIHDSCPYQKIEIDTQYQIAAAKVNIGRPYAVTIANVYIPGSSQLILDEICKIVYSMPKPVIILGDFNAHGTDWGNRKTTNRERVMEQLMDRQQLNMLNDGTATHISGTDIVLTITLPELTPDCYWQVYGSVINSDHFPIILTIAKPLHQIPVQTERSNYKKASLQQLQHETWKELQGEKREAPWMYWGRICMSDYTQQQRIAYLITSQGGIIQSLGGAGSARECGTKGKGCT